MSANLISSAEWLKAANNRGYGALPIPDVMDARITELLRAWAELDASLRADASPQVLEEQRFTLLAYGERMASLAVRVRSAEHIFFGLLGLGVDGWRVDWRDNILVVSLHYDAAERIDVIPEEIFERAASLLPPKVAVALRGFLRRTPADKSIGAMGYVGSRDRAGFRYERTW
jgi:hypothetical protein